MAGGVKMLMRMALFGLMLCSCALKAEPLHGLPPLDRHLILTRFLQLNKKDCGAVMQAGRVNKDQRGRVIWAVRCTNRAHYLLRVQPDGHRMTDILPCDAGCIATLQEKLNW